MLNRRYNLVTAPSVEPVTLTEAKAHLRVDTTDDDALITALIVASRISAELFTRRVFITQTWQLFMDVWHSNPHHNHNGADHRGHDISSGVNRPFWWNDAHSRGDIQLNKSPLQSVTSIKVYDDASVATIFAATSYHVFPYSGDAPEMGRITLKLSAAAPLPTRNGDGIEIEFVAGYGLAVDVPEGIKQAIMQEIMFRYENRGDCECAANEMLDPTAKLFLMPYKLMRL